MFVVSDAAVDRNLLTLAEMKAALGITDSGSDVALTTLGLQISDMIAAECRVPVDGVQPPTLRRETVVETFRHRSDVTSLVLSRRFVDAVANIAENDVELAPSDYAVEKAAGLISRLSSAGNIVCWRSTSVTVTYSAGFDLVPEALKLAAITILREQWSTHDRDPLVRSETVDDVSRIDYWVGGFGSSSKPSAISPSAAAMLAPFMHHPL
jgi:hypothetical protein